MNKDKVKTAFKYILAAVVGYFVVSEVVVCLFLTPLAFSDIQYSHDTLSPYRIVYHIREILFFVVGILLGIYATKKRNILYEVFRIKKWNFIPNLMFVAAFFLIVVRIDRVGILIQVMIESFTMMSSMQLLTYIFVTLPLGLSSTAFYFYPFFAVGHYVIREVRRKSQTKILLWIILAILLNPYFLMKASKVDHAIQYSMYYRYCGAKVVDFAPDSVAQKAGMQREEVITRIDDIEVKYVNEVMKYFQALKKPRKVTVVTDRATYELTPTLDPESGHYRIGIALWPELCRE